MEQTDVNVNAYSPSDLAKLYSDSTIVSRLKEAQKRVNLDDAEMEEIIFQYIQDTPVMFENLNHAWQRNDYDAMMLYAHSIVGVARLLKLHEVGKYAKAVEERAKQQLQPDEDVLILLNEHHMASLDTLRRLY